ncbi:hypothetical protein FH972_027251 [Carpinus fangiana]|uniref:Uncharacterized protein n=1 Tax=Carpinus fangiana TaxID=176857 RepID=A0A5N6L6F9_9ROSI|nr:hypothetical protein FH972_027251 [Carpinus fangiana]
MGASLSRRMTEETGRGVKSLCNNEEMAEDYNTKGFSNLYIVECAPGKECLGALKGLQTTGHLLCAGVENSTLDASGSLHEIEGKIW